MAALMTLAVENDFATEEVPAPAPAADSGSGGMGLLIGLVAGALVAVLMAIAGVVVLVFGTLLLGMATWVSLAVPEPPPPYEIAAAPHDTAPVAAVAAAPSPAASPLKLAVNVTGKKTFELVNLSQSDYTNVTVVLNGEYQYRVKKLVRNAGDSMRYGNFVSRRTGAEPDRKVELKSIQVTTDQGSWSRTL
ncbi:MAG: hypothetical protein R3F61_29890 [Myxococcota bacterium]